MPVHQTIVVPVVDDQDQRAVRARNGRFTHTISVRSHAPERNAALRRGRPATTNARADKPAKRRV
jgi:hypothetical protein